MPIRQEFHQRPCGDGLFGQEARQQCHARATARDLEQRLGIVRAKRTPHSDRFRATSVRLEPPVAAAREVAVVQAGVSSQVLAPQRSVRCDVARTRAQQPRDVAESARHEIGIGERCNPHGDVVPPFDRIDQSIVEMQVDADAGKPLHEARQQPRQPVDSEGHRRIDAQRPLGLVLAARNDGIRFSQAGEHVHHALVVVATRVGDPQRSARSHQQLHAEGLLERRHQLADLRSRLAHAAPRSSQAAEAHRLGEGFQLRQLRHAPDTMYP